MKKIILITILILASFLYVINYSMDSKLVTPERINNYEQTDQIDDFTIDEEEVEDSVDNNEFNSKG